MDDIHRDVTLLTLSNTLILVAGTGREIDKCVGLKLAKTQGFALRMVQDRAP